MRRFLYISDNNTGNIHSTYYAPTEDAEGAEGFRVPMSLGEPHAELDKSGKGLDVSLQGLQLRMPQKEDALLKK